MKDFLEQDKEWDLRERKLHKDLLDAVSAAKEKGERGMSLRAVLQETLEDVQSLRDSLKAALDKLNEV